MTTNYAHLNGLRVRTAYVVVPYAGVWAARVGLDVAASVSGSVTLTLGDLALVGTAVVSRSGSFEHSSSVSIVGGAGTWRSEVAQRHYHNDAGVKRSTVAAALAAEIGETLTLASDVDGVVGVDFVRQRGPASRVLEQLFPSTPWWVAYDGTTTVGARPGGTVAGDVRVLEVEAGRLVATLAGDGLAGLVPGLTVEDERVEGLTIGDLEIMVDEKATRVRVWGRS